MDATERLVAHFEEADVDTQALGGAWYRESQRVARRLARKHGVRLSTAAGVIAALSPRIRWASNVALADAMLGGEEIRGVFRRNVEKAENIIAGDKLGDDPLMWLGGQKVTAFYRAIMGDEDAAVIDVWMYRAAGYDPLKGSPARYREVEQALREAAEYVNIGVAKFQAIVWTQVRGGSE
jgi:hypothetical protein